MIVYHWIIAKTLLVPRHLTHVNIRQMGNDCRSACICNNSILQAFHTERIKTTVILSEVVSHTQKTNTYYYPQGTRVDKADFQSLV